jgi:pimeloyl-ACP methyl ester carboxylesterase
MRSCIAFPAVLVNLLAAGLVVAVAEAGSSTSTPAGCAAPRKLDPGEAWTDPSPHRCGYVTVNGVRLHYLDWGGSGEPLVLLHGLGTTAHNFDDLAPRLTGRFRVLALTRRGHAESDHPESGYTIRQTTADVLGFLDTLGIGRAHVIAHSLGGAEATRLAVEHPDRVHRVIYLDALPDWTDVDSIIDRGEPERPAPGDAFRSVATHRAWLHRAFYGFWTPALEADFRYSGPNAQANSALRNDAFAAAPEYSRLGVPALAIVATHTLASGFPWLDDPGADPDERRRAREYVERVFNPYQRRRAERFRREAPRGEVLLLDGSHYIHVSHLDEVVRAITAFVAG